MSERVLGRYFRKKNILVQCSIEGRVFEKFQKNQKILKIPEKPKTFPKVCKRVLNMFWGNLTQQFFARCSMEGRAFENFRKNQKNFKIQKMPLIVSKSVHTCFENALGRFIRIFFAQCSMQAFSDFLDLKLWVQFSGLKNRSLGFRT